MLIKYEVAEMPETPQRHNFGDVHGIVSFEQGVEGNYNDEIAEISYNIGLPYFRKKIER